jgi:two-component system chemotaxis response regulator CheY
MKDELRKAELEALHEECRERLDGVEQDLLDFADGRVQNSPEFINRVFRAFHNIKGVASYLHCDPLQRLSHKAESVLAEVRDGKRELSTSLGELLLSVSARMAQMIEAAGRPDAPASCPEIALLDALLARPTPPRPAGFTLKLDEASPAPSKSAPASPRRLKMLVVEDDFTARVLLQGILMRHGDCHIAVNGREALTAFRLALETGQPYDLICLDILMPEMDGTEVLRQIRSIEDEHCLYARGAKIFMTTSIQEMKSVTGSFRSLCDAYLFKPIEGDKIEDHLRSFGLLNQTA